MGSWLVIVAAGIAALAAPGVAVAADPEPTGIFGQTFGRFDRDTLEPSGANIEIGEAHAAPVLSPDGARLALGVSSPGPPGLPGTGRVGLWIVERAAMRLHREVRTGIAAEAVVFPGVVGALLQDGQLVVVDPESGRIASRRQVGYSHCAPPAVHADGRGVIVNELHPGTAEVAVIDRRGRVRTRSIAIDTRADPCRQVDLVAGGDGIAYVVGRRTVVAFDPSTMRTTTHDLGDLGLQRSAAAVPGGLGIASERGLRVLDTRSWRTRWRDAEGRTVHASGSFVVVSSSGRMRGRDARTGRIVWRADGTVWAVAAGRVYTRDATLDLRTGAMVGTHAVVNTRIRLM